jgi:CheY-like chemotaxis protein
MTAKILVADDSATIRKIIGLAFSLEDAEVKSVSNGTAAMDAARDFQPDIVLADVFMPGFNGYEVCERIKQDPKLSGTPVMLLVGTFEPFDESEAARVGCDAHLTKPFDSSEMIETVRALVGNKLMPPAGKASHSVSAEGLHPSTAYNSNAASTSVRDRVNPEVWDSYLSDSPVLDIFDRETRDAVNAVALWRSGQVAADGAAPASDTKSFDSDDPLSEKLLSLIVDRIVRRISPDIIREVAWEVVPDLSEILIRQVIEERDKD